MTAQELRNIRQRLGLTPAELARTLALYPGTIWRCETGRRPISTKLATRVYALAGELRCPTCGQPMPSDHT